MGANGDKWVLRSLVSHSAWEVFGALGMPDYLLMAGSAVLDTWTSALNVRE